MRSTLCTLSLLTLPLGAQQPALFHDGAAVADHDFGSGVIVGAAVSGNFTEDGLKDAIVHTRDSLTDPHGELHLVYGPPLYNGIFELPLTDVYGFDVIPGGAPNGLDALVVSVATGLELWWIDDLQWTSSTISSTGAAAPCLVVANLDLTGGLDVVGIQAGAGGVFCIMEPLTTATATSFSVTPSVCDIQALDWDDSSGLELALLLDGDLRITDRTGVQIAAAGFGGDDWSITVVQEDTSTYDRLAGSAVMGANEYLFAWDDNGGAETLAWISAQGIVSVASADMDGDGRGDLLAPRVASQNVRMFTNDHPNPPTFQEHTTSVTNQLLVLGDEAASPMNSARPVVDDFDLDGDPDVLVGDQLGNTVAVLRNKMTSHIGQAPDVLGALLTYDTEEDEGTITLQLDSQPFLPIATEYVLRVWTTADGVSALKLESEGTEVDTLAGSGPTEATFELTHSVLSDRVYWFDIRYQNPSTGYQSSPRIAACMTTVESAEAVAGLPGVEPPVSPPPSIFDAGTGLPLQPHQISGETQIVVREVGQLPCFEMPTGTGIVPGGMPSGN